ncbi:uncharacterized protein N7496_001521 [Penicillium cataractarum]|uniref:Uncharacterized protein n=1 Tax=Penicillium cataractarum TaxID=2100454 RepID=A0A9X0B701_9EURO|nr:uncharacterized protein N7496_001521 [Penicillium cataractarum]KAJ5390453.1 hypothetical protein N7496_001521 [Penicillium cataractarum]
MVFHLFGLRALEVWLYGRLIRSPLFHQMVGRVHQRVEQIRHGIPPEPSRTTLEEKGSLDKFVRYFKEEIQDQMKGKPPNKL